MNALNNQSIHIVQLGDSHTAGDSMTEGLRTQLQTVMGNGGMGWGMPMFFSGQRLSKYGYDNQAWQPISSRSNQAENYTLGGLIAKPLQSGATLTIKAKQYDPTQTFVVSLRQGESDGKFTGVDANGQQFSFEAPVKNGKWQLTQFTAKPPFTIQAHNAQHSAIGGWWGFNAQGKGATVSALGINGSELSQWNRWNSQAWKNELGAIRPQLIILAYGTNEAYNNVSPEQVQAVLTERVQQIRQASPQSAILILSAPESLKSTAGACGTRPSQLTAIQQAQKHVAQTQRTFYWNWQHAMGGTCSMKSWINQGKASRDGVHFTHTGYLQLGRTLAVDLLNLRQGGYSPTYAQQNTSTPSIVPVAISQNTHSFTPIKPTQSKICITEEGGKQYCRTY